jgi:hypothetical protein
LTAVTGSSACLWFSEDAGEKEAVLGFLRALVLSELLKSGIGPEEAVERSGVLVAGIGTDGLLGLLKEAGWDTANHFLSEAGRRIRVERE